MLLFPLIRKRTNWTSIWRRYKYCWITVSLKQVFLLLKQWWPQWLRLIEHWGVKFILKSCHQIFSNLCLKKGGWYDGYAEPGLAGDLESCHECQSSTLLQWTQWQLILTLIKVGENFSRAAAQPVMSWQFPLQNCPGRGFWSTVKTGTSFVSGSVKHFDSDKSGN